MASPIYLRTSAFTAAGWQGAFYPSGRKSADYLSFYTTKFQTVEIDSTFYASPAASTVTGWRNKTPESFIVAAKVPHEITHEKCLLECDEAFGQFAETMSILGSRLGPLLLQSGVQFLWLQLPMKLAAGTLFDGKAAP